MRTFFCEGEERRRLGDAATEDPPNGNDKEGDEAVDEKPRPFRPTLALVVRLLRILGLRLFEFEFGLILLFRLRSLGEEELEVKPDRLRCKSREAPPVEAEPLTGRREVAVVGSGSTASRHFLTSALARLASFSSLTLRRNSLTVLPNLVVYKEGETGES